MELKSSDSHSVFLAQFGIVVFKVGITTKIIQPGKKESNKQILSLSFDTLGGCCRVTLAVFLDSAHSGPT